jgi:hypothetical protein
MTDTPTFDSDTNGGNFCTANSVYRGDNTTDAQYGLLSEGNLTHGANGSANGGIACTHLVPPSGKWYFEWRIDSGGGSSSYSPAMAIMDPNVYTFETADVNRPGLIAYDNAQNKVYKNSSVVGTYSGARGSDDEVMGIAVDMDNGAFYVRRDGTYQTISGGDQGDPESGASRTGAGATWTPASEYTAGMVPMSMPGGGTQPIITMNFGQNGDFNGQETAGDNTDATGYGNFFSAVPTDYKAICTGNLATPAADPAGSDAGDGGAGPQNYFSPIVWTGNGATGRAITGLGFQSDFIWFKDRDQAFSNRLYDTTRGITATGGWRLFSNTTGANTDKTSSGQDISAVGSDGFTLGASDANYTNYNTSPEVAWCWRANGGTTSSGSGDLTSTHQVDPTGYFSIVKATGDGGSGDKTISHGLSAAPDCILAKNLDTTYNWDTYFSSGVTAGSGMRLNTDETPFTGRWGTVNSSIFTCVENFTWASTNNYIYYCFANTEGYIKAGSYEGNGDANGTFVYTGFRPAWIMTKSVDSTSDWLIFDNKRLGYNVDNNSLEANDSAGAATTDMIDILSNGFKLRIATDPNVAETYVYLAMAHNPFKYATAR